MILKDKFNTKKIILNFVSLLEEFIKNELGNTNYNNRVALRGFNTIFFGDIELYNKTGFFVLKTEQNFSYIFCRRVEHKIDEKASFQIIKRITHDSEFSGHFEDSINKLFLDFHQSYISYASSNLKNLLIERIESSEIKKDSSYKSLFDTPDIHIHAFVSHGQETTRYKAGEGRNYRHTFIYTYKIICHNKSLQKNETYVRIVEAVNKFEKITVENENDLSMWSHYDGEKHFNGEIDYELSYAANIVLKTKDYWESQSFLNRSNSKYASILDNEIYFNYYVYLLILFFEIEESVNTLLLNKDRELKKDFECLFQIYQYVLYESRITTEFYNIHHEFEINLKKSFGKSQSLIMEIVKSKFTIDVDKALQNYYINRPNKYIANSISEDLANFYYYFNHYTIR